MLIGAIQTDKVITESGKTEQGTLLKGGRCLVGAGYVLSSIVTKCLHNEEYKKILTLYKHLDNTLRNNKIILQD